MSANYSTTTAILLAAGVGRRMGNRNKSLLEIQGRTILESTLDTVSPFCSHIVIAANPKHLQRTIHLSRNYGAKCVEGGENRFASLIAALDKTVTDYVLICDVARPHLRKSTIKSLQAAVADADGAAPVLHLRLRESIALISGNTFEAVLPREGLALTQTPQLFRQEAIRFVLERILPEYNTEVSLVGLHLRAGMNIVSVPGDRNNVKITYPEDLNSLAIPDK